MTNKHSVSSENKKYLDLGYEYGLSMSMYEEIIPPKDLTIEQVEHWQIGVNAAIMDRLS